VPTKSFHLLLVEDDREDAAMLRDLLAAAPGQECSLDHVETLAAAIARAAGDPGDESGPAYDLALLDLHLPDSAGLETFERLHAAAPALPVVVLTNLEDDEVAARAVREGAQDYLVKRRVDPALLERAIVYAVERARAEAALRESEERYALALAGAQDGLWDWNLATDQVYYSPRWESLLGLEPGTLAPEPESWLERIHADDREGFDRALEAHLAGRAEHLEHEYRIRTADGSDAWVLSRGLAIRDAAGRPTRMAGSMGDVTSRKRAEEQLLHDALHDGLTGLPNRALFTDRLGIALRRRRGARSGFAVLFLDLDRFKHVNDSLGHEVGDELLMQIGQRLAESLRPGDTVARLGGDEFALLVHDVSGAGEASRIAERIQAVLQGTFVVGGHQVFSGASIGIALSSDGYERPEEMLRDADIAMYRAKSAGRGRYEVFDREMHRSAVALLRLETELRQAVEREEFIAHYQPIVSLDDLRIVGFETLVRWRHPRRGLVRPAQFIAVAEETGLIVPIGWWVVAESCRQIALWRQRFPVDPALTVSCNISGKLFHQPDVVERLVELIELHELDPEALRLEVTENVVLDHGEAVLDRLNRVRALGVGIQIDDFGTGYSSLSYLQRFRYDTLKIDRSFIHRLVAPGDGQAIVQTILALGAHLDMNVIAEGIETVEQLRALKDLDCPQGQGFWFARPIPPPAVERMLDEQFAA